MELEKGLAVVQHDLKEQQRRHDIEARSRLEVEARLSEVEKLLCLQQQATQQEMDKSSQHAERLTALQKSVSGGCGGFSCGFCGLCGMW